MPGAYSETLLAFIAIGDDGISYRVERGLRPTTPAGKVIASHYCLPNGERVWRLGDGRFQLEDGTLLRVVGAHLSGLASTERPTDEDNAE